jgi:hypothetical protein
MMNESICELAWRAVVMTFAHPWLSEVQANDRTPMLKKEMVAGEVLLGPVNEWQLRQ